MAGAAMLAGCATASPVAAAGQQALCEAQGVRVFTGFPEAGRHDCVIAPDGSVVISVDHEPSVEEGINPSPWYAFRIEASPAGHRTVVLDYSDYRHRYSPEISRDGRSWSLLPDQQVTLNDRRTRASLSLDIPSGGLWVAGQPMSPSRQALAWTRDETGGRGFAEKTYGTSRRGADLQGFVRAPEGATASIIALTRQHPPEITGEYAYKGFLDRLLTRDDAAAKAFRAAHRIILAPMPNPDGVDGGHWRLNAGGIDLNRDWFMLTQPETQQASRWVAAEANGTPVVAFFDFHSTNRTVIYAPPLDAPSPTIAFLPALKERLDAALSEPPKWSYNHNLEGGTSKGWALATLKAPGITVELSDDETEEDARRIGELVADAMIDYFSFAKE
ncbi:MAG: M14 family zinc carboxypeptidase [Hyphomonadaceae bacterium]